MSVYSDCLFDFVSAIFKVSFLAVFHFSDLFGWSLLGASEGYFEPGFCVDGRHQIPQGASAKCSLSAGPSSPSSHLEATGNPNRTFPLRVQSLYRTRGAAKDKAKGSFYLACCLASPGSPRIRRVASECIYARYQFRAFERDFGNQCIFL